MTAEHHYDTKNTTTTEHHNDTKNTKNSKIELLAYKSMTEARSPKPEVWSL